MIVADARLTNSQLQHEGATNQSKMETDEDSIPGDFAFAPRLCLHRGNLGLSRSFVIFIISICLVLLRKLGENFGALF
ncbi:hypothetical protein K1719_003194 [Acacia pycnantha]|nr:hypothetical protein K1719_003194 [Acacia pycnantha]